MRRYTQNVNIGCPLLHPVLLQPYCCTTEGPPTGCCQAFPHLPLGHAAVVLRSLLEQLLADGLSLLLQATFSLQLLKLQVLKLFGSRLQRLSILTEAQRQCQRSRHGVLFISKVRHFPQTGTAADSRANAP